MNIPELPDSDETIALKELVEQLKISNEIALNDNKLNRKLLTQLTEMNEKLTTMDTKLGEVGKKASHGYVDLFLLLIVIEIAIMMAMISDIYTRIGNMRLY